MALYVCTKGNTIELAGKETHVCHGPDTSLCKVCAPDAEHGGHLHQTCNEALKNKDVPC